MIEILKTEWLTVLSVFLSGVISWIISAIYFYKGNRGSLQSSIICPMLHILAEPVSRKNNIEVKEIAKNPLIRFFSKREKEIFLNLIKEYRFVCSYNENSANATAIITDFEKRLKSMGIDPRNFPVKLDDGSYEYVYPDEINYLHIDIEKNI